MNKKVIAIALACGAIALPSEASTNWRFYVGGMYAKGFKRDNLYGYDGVLEFNKPGDVPTNGSYTFWAGMDIQFSLREKFFLETGLNFRESPYVYGRKMSETDPYTGETFRWYEINCGEKYGHRDMLSIPVRFGYKIKLRGDNQFEFAVGPYFGADFDADYYVGLSPMVTYKHRALSLSFHWENPVFLNTSHNHFKNQFAFSIGVNFNGRKPNMDNILLGLEAAGAVIGTANQAMSQYYESSGSSSYSASASGSSHGNDSSNSSNGFSLSEQQAYNTDKSTYAKYDSQLASHFAGNQVMSCSQVRQIQKKMEKLRKKWESKGKSFPKYPNESRGC
ncbi:MAG: hypothetical protein K2L46_08945 [Paramuribaculum sp.]|nr:hypothetical protein [Paramuribaculum sp.]MDE6489394.1 hypothetical protein [Paramuribaculum sp.]